MPSCRNSDGVNCRARSNGAYVWGGAQGATRSYTANGLNQYTAVASSLGPTNISLGYDAKGDLTSQSATSGGNTVATNYGYDTLGRLNSWTGGLYMEYGALEEFQGYGSTRFSYDGVHINGEYALAGGSPVLSARYVFGPVANNGPSQAYSLLTR